ncbi:MAG: LuxR C-terminal-related transcriptional regulator [Xanthomonadales bacterium]|nr:LuxR C-terminal-related transcriptional regulator [Xanthomonadales bacterium]
MAFDVDDQRPIFAVLGLFVLIAVLIGLDVANDLRDGIGWLHITIELLVLLIAAGGVLFLWVQLLAARSGLTEIRREAEQWRRENEVLLQGLSAAIQQQFERWQLSEAESEVALLMLKGLSHKEIAQLRQTSERTIREQARAVYRKAHLPGRAALSAFFLEDLLLPARPSSENGPVKSA